MRERRSTVRVNCFLPAQYRPFETTPEFSGLVTDVSVEGLRLLADHPCEEGQQVRVSFALPDHGRVEALAVQGIVRWRAAQGQHGYPTGLEFEQLDETSRFRLQAFIAQRTEPSQRSDRSQAAWARKSSWINALSIGWPLVVGLIAAGGCLWILSLRREQERLQHALQERAAVMAHLQAQQDHLQQELNQTRVTASLIGIETRQLESQREAFGQEIARLGTNLNALNQEFANLQAERDALKQWVQALEQQQRVLEQRLSSIPELRKALRHAHVRQSRRQRAQLAQWWAARFGPRASSVDRSVEGGNRGYLVRDGQSTASSGSAVPLEIRVLSPESMR